ncbi:MAG: hypothetical protein ABUS79_02765 [Pseudomonadota bacterium]
MRIALAGCLVVAVAACGSKAGVSSAPDGSSPSTATGGAGGESAQPPGSGGAVGATGGAAQTGGSIGVTGGATGADARPPDDAADAATGADAADGGVATATDGGVADRPADTAGGGDAATGACRFRLCETFENAAIGAPPDPAIWTRTGNITVDTAPDRPGKAMRVRAGQTPTETYISQTAILPALGNAFYGRVFLYIAARPTEFFHWSFTEVRGTNVQGASVRYGGISTGNCAVPGMFCRNSFLFQVKPLVYGADEGATADDDFPTPLIAEKTWHCIEWYMNSTTRETRLWWNDQERPKMHYLDGKAIPFPTFTRFYLGWALYQTGTTPWEVWLDDLALHDQRIGCTP